MATKKAASAGEGTLATPAVAPRRDTAPATPKSRPRALPAQRARPLTTARPKGERTALSVGCLMKESAPLSDHLRARVIGQDEAIDALVCSWGRLLSGLRDPARPMLTALLLGPTGVGKTETAKALAEALFGSTEALVRVDCEEYANGHEVAKLLGSPPGYVGADIEPLLSQARIDKAHWLALERRKANGDAAVGLIEQVHGADDGLHSIILFDEIEKAHPSLWNALLGILDDGRITLGNNKTTDLTRSIILMTSNVGSRQMSTALERRTVGFLDPAELDESHQVSSMQGIARSAAHEVFPAEFLNRFDEVLAYSPLGAAHLGEIFDKFLDAIAQRALDLAGVPMLTHVSEPAKRFVIAAGTDPRLGARPLRRAMERLVVDPLSRLIASGQVKGGDVVEIELHDDALTFYRLPRATGAIVA